MHRKILLWGLVLALVSVILGAFGAHALKSMVTADKVIIFETGVRYQFMHALALIAVAIYTQLNQANLVGQKSIHWSFRFYLLGILFFSGSLYLLSFQSLCSYNYSRIVGPTTPIGGLFFMMGWVQWIRVVWRNKVDK